MRLTKFERALFRRMGELGGLTTAARDRRDPSRLKARQHDSAANIRKRTSGHNCWMTMQARCLNPKNPSYKYYGGAGVKVCKRWLGHNGFTSFSKDVGRRPSSKHSIGRYGDVGDYSPTNCKWMTVSEHCEEAKKKRTGVLC